MTVMWTTEGFPDLRIPEALLRPASALRSLAEYRARPKASTDGPLIPGLHRLRYRGDLQHAYSRGWLDVLTDISDVYARRYRSGGLPVEYAPFGSFPGGYEDLGLTRDIDVLWMGKRATRRRSKMLDGLEHELDRRGIRMHVVDGVRRPFVFGEERTRLLNRSRITLNLLRTWYDENSMRFFLAAPNRSLFVSESLMPHVPDLKPGVHYVHGSPDLLPDLIERYLERDEERDAIVDHAYEAATAQLTLERTARQILGSVERVRTTRRQRHSGSAARQAPRPITR